MIIRSITFFTNIDENNKLEDNFTVLLTKLSVRLRDMLTAHGDMVQSIRMATNSFCHFLSLGDASKAIQKAIELEQAAIYAGVDYLSLGPALPGFPGSYRLIPEILGETRRVFFTGEIANAEYGVDLSAIHQCSAVIKALGELEENGFANLFFAATANLPGRIPFLPAAYQNGNGSGFALAIEAGDVAVSAIMSAGTLEEARHSYIEQIEWHAKRLEQLIQEIIKEPQFEEVEFYGFDMTPAPYITEERSVGTVLAQLSGVPVGSQGSLAAAAFLMDALDQARFRRSGFNGLMMPVLEDVVLAKSAADGTLSIRDLLLMSTVCGTGLDTVPIPGETSTQAIEAILRDVAFLSSRLQKPLTARLMPIPGKKAGEMTAFQFDYFVNTRVMPVDEPHSTGKLPSNGRVQIHPKSSYAVDAKRFG
ncbi:MAG: DUF711 family protein [Anaerolineae bacterium]|nr:DUF711 family protein [Anaerolineae bacterium]